MSPLHRPAELRHRIVRLAHAIRDEELDVVEKTVALARSRRIFAPLVFVVGAIAILFNGVRLLLTNWRLMLIQILPAMWLWLAMLDLKVHVLKGRTFNVLRGPVLIPIVLAIVAITAAGVFLNAVFAFAIAESRPPHVRSGMRAARARPKPILISGAVMGLLLAFSTTIVTRWGHPWFALALGATVGLMMVAYVAVPSRLIGAAPISSKRDKLAASALGAVMSTAVCTPPYLLGRVAILMLGSSVLLAPGVVLLVVGATLQAGATGAVRAIRLSATLMAGKDPDTAVAAGAPSVAGSAPALELDGDDDKRRHS